MLLSHRPLTAARGIIKAAPPTVSDCCLVALKSPKCMSQKYKEPLTAAKGILKAAPPTVSDCLLSGRLAPKCIKVS